jgi:DNA-binding ferritin-like protein
VFAERALHLGFSIDGRYSTIARTTKIPDMTAGYLADDDSLKLIIESVTVLHNEIYQIKDSGQ